MREAFPVDLITLPGKSYPDLDLTAGRAPSQCGDRDIQKLADDLIKNRLALIRFVLSRVRAFYCGREGERHRGGRG